MELKLINITHVIAPDILLLYDCENYKGDYIGRVSIAIDYDNYKKLPEKEQFNFERWVLDQHPILKKSCSWRKKIVSSDLIMDHCEFGEW